MVNRKAGRLPPRPRFRSEFLDFEKGIRMGHLEPEERITQIIKQALKERYGMRFLCDRWGRGVYWQWICWVPEANRSAKPLSSKLNFSSAKFFIAVEREKGWFQTGMQVERAPKSSGAEEGPAAVLLEKDWDWHVLLAALRGKELPRELERLRDEGFRVRAGGFRDLTDFSGDGLDVAALRRRCARFSPRQWGGFQLFYAMPPDEVAATSGQDLVDSMLAVFEELRVAMNLCMTTPCLGEPSAEVGPTG